MTSRPIPFSGEMIRAIREGRKTQTRRVIVPHRGDDEFAILDERDKGGVQWPYRSCEGGSLDIGDGCEHRLACKYGEPGDQLWVRETCYICPSTLDGEALHDPPVVYAADGAQKSESYPFVRVPRFMPRWASRITLEITDIRVERLQDITEADARAEGVGSVAEFQALWETINGKKHAWDTNPWLWVISFRRVSE